MKHECRECEGTSFTVEMGVKVCNQCGVELRGYVELRSQETMGMVDRSRLISAKGLAESDEDGEDEETDVEEKGLNKWTTYEAYNIILHEWTKALCGLGASAEFRHTVLKLWAAYLIRLNVAFLPHSHSEDSTQTPKASFLPNMRDIQLLHKRRRSVSPSTLSVRSSKKGKNDEVTAFDKMKAKIERKKITKQVRGGGNSSIMSHTVASELSRSLIDFDTSSFFSDTSRVEGKEGEEDLSTPSQPIIKTRKTKEKASGSGSVSDGGSKSSPAESSGGSCLEPKTMVQRNTFVRNWLEKRASIYGPGSDEESDMEEDDLGHHSSSKESSCIKRRIRSSAKKNNSATHKNRNATRKNIATKKKHATRENNASKNDSATRKNSAAKNNHATYETKASRKSSASDCSSSSSASFFDPQTYQARLTKMQKERLRKKNPSQITFRKLLALLYLAVLLAKEDILLMDIIRWCREGHIPYLSAQYLLPASMPLLYYDTYMFKSLLRVPMAEEVQEVAGNMAFFLNLQQVPLPPVEDVITKLVKSLSLPESVGILAQDLCNQLSRTTEGRVQSSTIIGVPAVECQAAAGVVMALKLRCGLNGSHEDQLSWVVHELEEAYASSQQETPHTSHPLFSWLHWHRHMNRVVWLCGQVDPVCAEHYQALLSSKPRTHTSLLARLHWTQGIWTLPQSKDKMKKVLQMITSKILQAQGRSLEEVLAGPGLYQASHLPFISIIQQFLNQFRHETDQELQEYVQISEEIMKKSFTFHTLDWNDNLQDLQMELRKQGSKIEVYPSCIWKENATRTQKLYFKLCKDPTNLSLPSNILKNRNQQKFYVPQPLEMSWKINNIIGTKLKTDAWNNLPASFRWLVRLVSRVCETSERQVLWMLKRMERVTVIKKAAWKGRQTDTSLGSNL